MHTFTDAGFYYSCRTGILGEVGAEFSPNRAKEMPIDYRKPDPSTGIDLETPFSGTVVPAEVTDYLKGVHHLHANWEGRRAVVTFTPDAEASGLHYATVSEIASVSRAFTDTLAGSRMAAVAPRPLFFGLLIRVDIEAA